LIVDKNLFFRFPIVRRTLGYLFCFGFSSYFKFLWRRARKNGKKPDLLSHEWKSAMMENRTYKTRLTVPFHDLDPLYVVWHGNYMKYFDIARFGVFNRAGIDLYRYSAEKKIIFPLIRTSQKYISPLRHNDEFECRVTILDASVKIAMEFEIRRVEGNELCAKGWSDQAAVQLPEMKIMFEIPRDIREKFGF
jgi:acyl-CoA thioester hydrolase